MKREILNKNKNLTAKVFTLIFFLFLFIFVLRLGYLCLTGKVDGINLRDFANERNTKKETLYALRGNVYDVNGDVLAQTINSYTIIAYLSESRSEGYSKPQHVVDKEMTAEKLSTVLNMTKEKILERLSKKAYQVEFGAAGKGLTELQKEAIENLNLPGIDFITTHKRYYPNNNLASQVIGFCGSDNQGLDGIEAIYEKELKGEKGKINKIIDARGGEIAKEGENYVKAIDGNDLILSIDATVQGIAEKYLAEACIDNKCTDGGNIIIMNPQTGDILAMAGYPNYNLNQPYQANTEELKASWEMLAQGEKTKALQQMWRNKAVSDTYEPGSTFKLITTSAALEEGLTSVDKEGEFCCTGGIEIAGVRIKCWRYYRPHGSESLRQALMNSCNPVFIGLGQKIGVSKYYTYLKKFGLLKRTGIDLPGEAGSIFLKEEKVGPVELATIAFGQRFEITPLQLITAVSSIANGGTYIKPRIVKKIINSQTGETTEIPIKREERVISEETAKNVLSMMQSVVEDGTGRNAQVEGYNIGGKTGTSEDGVNTNKYVTSFMGVGPTTNPQVVILVTLYNPTGEGGHHLGVNL